uniref:Uncharacterized protein n=1 Tax=Tetranychus urticae TaxID=32264 RepID=T1KIG9_TETUR
MVDLRKKRTRKKERENYPKDSEKAILPLYYRCLEWPIKRKKKRRKQDGLREYNPTGRWASE